MTNCALLTSDSLSPGLSQAVPVRQSCTAIEIVPKKSAKGTICPLQNLGKKLERKTFGQTHEDIWFSTEIAR